MMGSVFMIILWKRNHEYDRLSNENVF